MKTPRNSPAAAFGRFIAWLMLCVSCCFGRTAEDSFHFRNMSSEPPGEPARQDLFPQVAVAGNLVHLAWLSLSEDSRIQRLMYRRSADGGNTFEAAQVLISGSEPGFLDSGLSIQDGETGQMPAYLAADGQSVHLALLRTPLSGAAQIVYFRSTDGGETFSPPQVWATVKTDPPPPAAGRGHTAVLRPPMVAACEGRVLVAFGHTDARAVYFEYPGWVYGYYPELSVSWSDDGGTTFHQSTLHGTPPTARGAAPAQITIQGSEVLFAARDSAPIGWGALITAVHAGVSNDGGANIHFRQLTPDPVTTSYFGDTVRVVKHGAQLAVFFASEDEGEPVLGTLYQCRSMDGGDTWSAPHRLTEAPSQIDNQSSFTVASHGAEILVATTYYEAGVTAGRVAARRSTDWGATYAPWTTLADASDPRSNVLTPLDWPRFALWPGQAGEARAALLWGTCHLVTSAGSGASYGPARMIRPPAEVLPLRPPTAAPRLAAGPDGSLHLTITSNSGTDPYEMDVYYRRICPGPESTAGNQALALGSNLPPVGDVSTPRHRDSLQVAAAPSLATGTAFTIEFWARFQGDAVDRLIFSSGWAGLALRTTASNGTNRFEIELTTDAGTHYATGTTLEPQPGTWHHLALRYDASRESGQLTLFVDGTAEATTDADGARMPESQPFVFGNYYGNSANDFTGEIDDIRFWNVALTDETIRARRAPRLSGTEPGLAAWFPLDGNTRDASGNLPDGMLSCRESFVPGVEFETRPQPPSGLVSWWAAEGDFTDRMDRNHASPVGAVAFSDAPSGRAFLLDGQGAHVAVASPTALPLGAAPRTMSVWFRTPQDFSVSPNSAIVEFGTPSTAGMFGLITSLNAPRKLYFYGHARDLAGTTNLLPNTWYHAAVTYDGSILRMYLDGQLENQAPLALDTLLDPYGFTIGLRPGINVWRGELDDVMIFDRTLTAAEVAGLHAAGHDGFAPPSGSDPGEPVAPPVSLTRTATGLALAWPSASGHSYLVEKSTTLLADDWWPASAVMPGTGETMTYELPVGLEDREFIRLRVTSP